MITPRGPRGVPGEKGVPGETGATGESSPYLGRRQTLALAGFIVAAFLLLSVRTEINAGQTNANADRITMTQRAACESGLEILVKFNRQQDALIEIERSNTGVDAITRAARIKAYQQGRIDPLPVCGPIR